MSDVFVSYKREDEARVILMVRALESTGRSVWWDRGLAGAENWRQQIQTALDGAKCVIVAWTDASVGPAGDFVRDEASEAKRRGVLVPVLLDQVRPPLGFGEVQAIDLTRWKGNPRDPFFEDLRAAVTAKLEGRPVPPAKGPTKRLIRRLTYSGVASAIGFAGVAFSLNAFDVQDRLCSVQPYISDTCGALGLGHRPARTERLAWDGRAPGDCSALRAHIERFPEGAYSGAAADTLAARRVTQTEVWTPATHNLTLFVPQDDVVSPNEDAARASALARGQSRAQRLCSGFAATGSFRLTSALPVPDPNDWQCTRVAGGVACAFEGKAVCELEARQIREVETCGQ